MRICDEKIPRKIRYGVRSTEKDWVATSVGTLFTQQRRGDDARWPACPPPHQRVVAGTIEGRGPDNGGCWWWEPCWRKGQAARRLALKISANRNAQFTCFLKQMPCWRNKTVLMLASEGPRPSQVPFQPPHESPFHHSSTQERDAILNIFATREQSASTDSPLHTILIFPIPTELENFGRPPH
jgi:hypothetical protein